jgi:hypothetical protein
VIGGIQIRLEVVVGIVVGGNIAGICDQFGGGSFVVSFL